mmetsp:Transcript_32129/g.64005  ORF Transcript_32129/g.64005 Transcript_32129/m.64005 type:complete len:239 (-) Transcript_32129:731-1447(-)
MCKRPKTDANSIAQSGKRTITLRKNGKGNQTCHELLHGYIRHQSARHARSAENDTCGGSGGDAQHARHTEEGLDQLGNAIWSILHVASDERLSRHGHGFGKEAHEPPHLERHLMRSECHGAAESGRASEHGIGEHESDGSREEGDGHGHEGFDHGFGGQASPYQCHVSERLGGLFDGLVQSGGCDDVVNGRSYLSSNRGGGGTGGTPSFEQSEPHVTDEIDHSGSTENLQWAPGITSS